MAEQASNAAHLAQLLKVMADATRLRILGLLAEREHNGKELGERLGLTPPTVSHHMRKLVDAGIVTATSVAQRQRYALNTRLLLDARKTPVEAVASADSDDPDQTDEQRIRARVLRTFFDGERLKSIPARRKQRVIVLQHVMERFDPIRTYTEREVNDLLRPARDDVATLRRELVDYGYMLRDRGIYQVTRAAPERTRQIAQEITGDEMAWLRGLLQTAIGAQPAARADDANDR